MSSIWSWSKTPINNQNSDADINWQEGQDSATVNNSSRQEMARVAEFRDDLAGTAISAGVGSNYTVTISSAVTAYFNGLTLVFKADRSNPGDATLNVNGIGAVPIRTQYNRPLIAGEIQANSFVSARYNTSGPRFEVTGVAASGGDVATRAVAVGDIIVSSSSAPRAGFVRLGQEIQNLNKADYPELNSWASAQGYPWGETGATFGIPPAAAYGLRFAATDSTIDPDGPRTAGSTQQDQNKAHDHGGATGPISVTPDAALGFSALAAAGGGLDLVNADGLGTPITFNATTPTISFDGGSEARGKNVAFHADMLARTEEAFLAQLALTGLAFSFNTDTADSDPGSGRLKFDNANPALAGNLYISNFDQFGVDISGALANIANFTIRKVSAPGEYIIMDLGSAVAASGYTKFPITNKDAVTPGLTIADGRNLQLTTAGIGPAGPQGNPGPAGPAGPNLGLDYSWDTGTADADPGNGNVRSSIVPADSASGFLYISKTDRNSNNKSVQIARWDDATTLADRGEIQIRNTDDAGQDFSAQVTGALVDATTYFKVPVTFGSVGSTLVNAATVGVGFSRSGDKGLDGAGAGDVVGPASAVDNRIAAFDGTTGKLIKDGGSTIADALNRANHTGTQTLATISDSGVLAALDSVGTAQIDNNAVTNAKIADMAEATVKGRATGGGAGDPEDLSADQTMALLDTATNAPARLASNNVFTKAQITSVTTLATWTTSWNIFDNNNFRVTTLVSGAAGNFPLPTVTGLAANQVWKGEIKLNSQAGTTAGFDAGWEWPGGSAGVPDLSAGGHWTLYARIENDGSTTHYEIASVAPWATV